MHPRLSEILEKFSTIDDTVDLDESDLTPIQEFYKDTNVFITGATGFLGHVLLEKLLRSCPVSKVYLLMRNKKGKSMEERLEGMFKDPLFERIRNQFPEAPKKVVLVEGDCLLPDLGLSDKDKTLLMGEIDVVFHVAATVRFDDKIRTAVYINVRATRDLCRLARQMPRLKSLVHVSTIYCNTLQDSIEEKVYPPAADYEGLIKLVETFPDGFLEKITPLLLDKYSNTYVYTKQIGEDVVRQEGQGLPFGIHRPGIVMSTYKEPVRGWINNVFGGAGLSLAAGIGLVRVYNLPPDSAANQVPVDMCVNSLIASAWEVSDKFIENKPSREIPVYNYDSATQKRITWRESIDIYKTGMEFPSLEYRWYLSITLVKSYHLYCILNFVLHVIPAAIVDAVLFCTGRPTVLLKAYRKIHKFSNVLLEFAVDWPIKSQNVQRLVGRMTDRDRKIFFSDLREVVWEEYLLYVSLGGRLYLLKDPLSTIPEARKRYRRLYWAHQAVKAAAGILLLWLLRVLLTFIYRLIFS